MQTEPSRRSQLLVIAITLGVMGAFWNLPHSNGAPSVAGSVRLEPKQRVTAIGFIGDSITEGVGARPKNTNAVERETALLGEGYMSANWGVSGTTSKSWLPTQAEGGSLADGKKTILQEALADFQVNNVHVVQIMLGTNDASRQTHTSGLEYRKNLQRIVNTVLATPGIDQVIINTPLEVTDSTRWNDKSKQLLADYASEITTLADGTRVYAGDEQAQRYFARHPNLLRDGIHPNEMGYSELGRLWANAYTNNTLSINAQNPIRVLENYTLSSAVVTSAAGMKVQLDLGVYRQLNASNVRPF